MRRDGAHWRAISARSAPSFDQSSGDHGCAQGADIRRRDATDGQARDVGDDLGGVAAGGRAAAHDEAIDRKAGADKQMDVPEEFARQPLDHCPEEVVATVGQGDPGQAASRAARTVGFRTAGQERPEKRSPSHPGGTASIALSTSSAAAAGTPSTPAPLDSRAAVLQRKHLAVETIDGMLADIGFLGNRRRQRPCVGQQHPCRAGLKLTSPSSTAAAPREAAY